MARQTAIPRHRLARVAECQGVSNSDQISSPSTLAEITALTGITDEMVAGRSIDPAAVEAFIADAAIVNTQNAKFDRPIAENDWPVFNGVDWVGSLDEILWRENGIEGTKLSFCWPTPACSPTLTARAAIAARCFTFCPRP
jgi:DNA polymerase-3 subunit epsilon